MTWRSSPSIVYHKQINKILIVACDKYYVKQRYYIQWGQKKELLNLPGCEWVMFSNEKTFEVDNKKKTFARKLKHKAVDQPVARHRSKELYDEFKNSKQSNLVVNTEGRKIRLKSISLGICYQWGRGRFWIGLVCWWNESFRNSDSLHLISLHTWLSYLRSVPGPKWLLQI